jgi:hypothetical protein
MEKFEGYLRLALSNDKSERLEGEAGLSSVVTQPSSYQYFLYGLKLSPELSALSAVLFRQNFIENHKILEMSYEQQIEISLYLKSIISIEKPIAFIKNIGYLIIRVFVNLKFDEELVNFIVMCSHTDGLREFCAFMIETLSNYSYKCLYKYENAILSALWKLLNEPDPIVQIMSSKTLCEIILVTSKTYSEAFDQIFQVIKTHKFHDKLYLLLESLAKLLETKPKIWESNYKVLIKEMIEISKDRKNSNSRVSSIEVILSLDKTNLSTTDFQEILALGFILLSEVDYYNDIQAWSTDIQDFNSINNTSFSLGKDLVASVAKIRNCRNHLMELVKAHLGAGHWVHQHAGVFGYGILCSYSNKFLAEFRSIVGLLQSENPRMQWVSLSSIACVLIRNSSVTEDNYDLIPLILPIMSSSVLKLQHQAIITLRCYCHGAWLSTRNSLYNYMTPISEAIYNILSSNTIPAIILTETFSLLGTFALAIQGCFIKFAPEFMIGLRNIIVSNTLPSIKSAAITTLGCIIEVINDPIYASSLFSEMIGIMGVDDVIDNSIMESMPQYAMCLKDTFSVCGNAAVNILLNNAKIQIGAKEDSSKVTVVASFELQGIEEKNWSLNIDELSKKITACKSLLMMSMLGDMFNPWLHQSTIIMASLLNYKYNSEIREHAMGFMEQIYCSSSFHQILLPALHGIYAAIVKPASKTNFEKLLNLLYLYLLNSSSVLVPIDFANSISSVLAKKFEFFYQIPEPDRSNRLGKSFVLLSKVVGNLFKVYRQQYKPIFDLYHKSLFEQALIIGSDTNKELIAGLGVMCDYIEYTGDLMSLIQTNIMEHFIKNCYSKNNTVRHNCAYGIALCAKIRPSEFFNYLHFGVNGLKFILSLPADTMEKKEANQCASDTLSKLTSLYYQENPIQYDRSINLIRNTV